MKVTGFRGPWGFGVVFSFLTLSWGIIIGGIKGVFVALRWLTDFRVSWMPVSWNSGSGRRSGSESEGLPWGLDVTSQCLSLQKLRYHNMMYAY